MAAKTPQESHEDSKAKMRLQISDKEYHSLSEQLGVVKARIALKVATATAGERAKQRLADRVANANALVNSSQKDRLAIRKADTLKAQDAKAIREELAPMTVEQALKVLRKAGIAEVAPKAKAKRSSKGANGKAKAQPETTAANPPATATAPG